MLKKDGSAKSTDNHSLTLIAFITYYLPVAYDSIAAHPADLSRKLSSKPQES
jgi:hypothetical protein